MSDNTSDNQQTKQQTKHQDIVMKPDQRKKILLSLIDERVFAPRRGRETQKSPPKDRTTPYGPCIFNRAFHPGETLLFIPGAEVRSENILSEILAVEQLS